MLIGWNRRVYILGLIIWDMRKRTYVYSLILVVVLILPLSTAVSMNIYHDKIESKSTASPTDFEVESNYHSDVSSTNIDTEMYLITEESSYIKLSYQTRLDAISENDLDEINLSYTLYSINNSEQVLNDGFEASSISGQDTKIETLYSNTTTLSPDDSFSVPLNGKSTFYIVEIRVDSIEFAPTNNPYPVSHNNAPVFIVSFILWPILLLSSFAYVIFRYYYPMRNTSRVD